MFVVAKMSVRAGALSGRAAGVVRRRRGPGAVFLSAGQETSRGARMTTPLPVRPEVSKGPSRGQGVDNSPRTEGGDDLLVLDAQSLAKHYPVSLGFMKPKAV